MFLYCASVPLCPGFSGIFLTPNLHYFGSIPFLCFSRKVLLLSKGVMRNFIYPSCTSQQSVPIQKKQIRCSLARGQECRGRRIRGVIGGKEKDEEVEKVEREK